MKNEIEDFVDEGEELIAEVRAARHRISERFGHDPYKLVAYYMERQKAHAERLIRAPEDARTAISAG
ncbi:MAG TPA: hypothetical protein VF092_15890 [Longimicrobium sp.]